MNEINREKVRDFIASMWEVSPIHFCTAKGYTEKELEDTGSIIGNIFLLLVVADRHATYNKDGSFQCHRNASRSVVDIWRLYRNYFNKNMSIFTIMHNLYTIMRTEPRRYIYFTKYHIHAFFCDDVEKFVFYPIELEKDKRGVYEEDSDEYDDNGLINPPSERLFDFHAGRQSTELDLDLYEWRNI